MPQTNQDTDPAPASPGRPNNRRWLRRALLLVLAIVAVDAWIVEPSWIRVRHICLTESPTLRIVHIGDLHYKGNTRFLRRVVDRINALDPQFVCFTGDLIEHADDLPAALEQLDHIACPIFAVPGNHDWHSRASFADIDAALKRRRGRWLRDETVTIHAPTGTIAIHGATGHHRRPPTPQPDADRNILLCHYPDIADATAGARFDLILAGHSHGGQVRLPFIGPIIRTNRLGPYDWGLYDSPAGPLYVTCGLGTYALPVRFFCRPEIILIEF